MNSKKISDAINKIFDEIQSMDKKQFKELIKKHKNGKYAIMLREMWREHEQRIMYGEPLFKPVVLPDKYKIWKYELDPNNKTQMFFFGLGIGVILMILFMIWNKI